MATELRSRVDRHGPRVTVRPIPIKKALPFVRATHRRLPKIQGAMWAIAAVIDDRIVGVAVVGHPQARMADDGVTLEVTRVAVEADAPNACSALYSACARAARDMGALDLYTSIHSDETGHSPRAAGWVEIGAGKGGEWSREDRPRRAAIDPLPKIRYAAAWSRLAQKKRDDDENDAAK